MTIDTGAGRVRDRIIRSLLPTASSVLHGAKNLVGTAAQRLDDFAASRSTEVSASPPAPLVVRSALKSVWADHPGWDEATGQIQLPGVDGMDLTDFHVADLSTLDRRAQPLAKYRMSKDDYTARLTASPSYQSLEAGPQGPALHRLEDEHLRAVTLQGLDLPEVTDDPQDGPEVGARWLFNVGQYARYAKSQDFLRGRLWSLGVSL